MPKKLEKKQEEAQKKLTPEEYEKKVIELADKGLTSEKIGEELKKHGIYSIEYNKKISKILGGKYINPDLKNTEKKLKKILRAQRDRIFRETFNEIIKEKAALSDKKAEVEMKAGATVTQRPKLSPCRV